MRFKISGAIAGRTEWVEWVDGQLSGSENAVFFLRAKEERLVGRPIGPAGSPAVRLMLMALDQTYGLPPVFTRGSASVETEGITIDQPEGSI